MKKTILAFAFLGILFSCGKNTQEAEISVSSVSLSQSTAEIIIGETVQLTATVLPSNASQKTITWASSKASVATVEAGRVTAIAEGTATITASAGGKSATCTVTVSKGVIAVTSIELNKTTFELVEGESETLTATVKPDDATDKTVTWGTSDKTIATVENGKVTALKEGEATITAKAGEKSATCRVIVSYDPLNEPIIFADSKVKALLVQEFDNNKDGELSYKEAKAVTSIGNCFAGITGITSFDEFQFFTGVTKIESTAFALSSITSIVLPNTIVDIGHSAFNSCSDLAQITIPEGLKTIDEWAFKGCVQLPSIVLPQSITGIGLGAFYNCSKLNSITVLATNVPSGGDEMFPKRDLLKIYVPSESIEAYQSAKYWKYYAGYMYVIRGDIPEGAVDLGLSVYWASCNIGSSNPEEFGDYYAWGESETYYSQLEPIVWKEGKDAGYNWQSYKWSNGSQNTLTKYCPEYNPQYWAGSGSPDGRHTLEKGSDGDDVASKTLGGKWRMPTENEMRELLNNCLWTLSTKNGIKGWEVQSKAEGNTNSIFIPISGYWYGKKFSRGSTAYLTSSVDGDNPSKCRVLSIDQMVSPSMSRRDRDEGYPIRAVSE